MSRSSASASRRGLRPVDWLMLVPALVVGVLLVAVSVADRTGVPLSELLEPTRVGDLVPAGLTSDASP